MKNEKYKIVFIEQQILNAVRRLLAGRVNELLGEFDFIIPLIEYTEYCGTSSVTPVILLSSCERTEKERIINIDCYSLSVIFSIPETVDSELYCYAYSNAFDKALSLDKTLGGIVECATITNRKYIQPKKLNCGQEWELQICLRVTVEQMRNEAN